jgi:phosphatidylglycerophosphatase A
MTSEPAPTTAPAKKPRISYLIATAFGLGYLKPGPGTWGSLGGVALTVLFTYPYWYAGHNGARLGEPGLAPFWDPSYPRSLVPFFYLLIVIIAFIGVIASGRVERYIGKVDPQFVVIDEVSGQLITFFGAPYILIHPARLISHSWWELVNWKCLLLGFILFRVFDIWKPFPARQAERLPGGWGIMADDWIAGMYAALGLWAARALGLLA